MSQLLRSSLSKSVTVRVSPNLQAIPKLIVEDTTWQDPRARTGMDWDKVGGPKMRILN